MKRSAYTEGYRNKELVKKRSTPVPHKRLNVVILRPNTELGLSVIYSEH